MGAAIGTAIPIPVLGTVVGAATGFAVGWIVSKGLNSEPVNKAKDWIKKELKMASIRSAPDLILRRKP